MKPARLPHRFIAHIIDLFVIGFIWIVCFGMVLFIIRFLNAEQLSELAVDAGNMGELPVLVLLIFLMALLTFSIIFHTYFVSMEFQSGQTIGKKMMRIKVVSEDGSPITRRQALYRDLVKVYFELTLTIPLFYIFFDKNHQRLGDKWAKTIVIENLSN